MSHVLVFENEIESSEQRFIRLLKINTQRGFKIKSYDTNCTCN